MDGGGQHDQVRVEGKVHVHVDGGEHDKVQVVGEVDNHVRGRQLDQSTSEAMGAGEVMDGGGQHDQVWGEGGVHFNDE